MKYDDDTQKGFIHSIVYMDDRYLQFLQAADVIELDASFTVCDPYVYYIPTVIIQNESFPIGFTICPSEKCQLYSEFYNF